jgi:hypothetical protein
MNADTVAAMLEGSAKIDVNDAFGGSAQDVRAAAPLRTVAMVGAYYENDQLSHNDAHGLFHMTRFMAMFKLPVDPALIDAARNPAATRPSGLVDAINIDPAYGNRDFLKEDNLRADVLMFCNIAWAHSQCDDIVENTSFSAFSVREMLNFQASMRVSDLNRRDDLWNEKTRATGAKIVVITGMDDFPAEKLAGDDFVAIRLQGFSHILLKKDYLAEMEPALRAAQSPLVSVLDALQKTPQTTHFSQSQTMQGMALRPAAF